jgi:hypothetical protein
MLRQRASEIPTDVPLDFIEFLSARLGVSREPALSALGSFLVTFKPSTNRGTHHELGSDRG